MNYRGSIGRSGGACAGTQDLPQMRGKKPRRRGEDIKQPSPQDGPEPPRASATLFRVRYLLLHGRDQTLEPTNSSPERTDY